jgi:hypothetical protein
MSRRAGKWSKYRKKLVFLVDGVKVAEYYLPRFTNTATLVWKAIRLHRQQALGFKAGI